MPLQRKFYIHFLAALVALFPLFLVAQVSPSEFAKYVDQFPDEPAVFLDRSESMEVKIENGEPVIYSRVRSELLFLTDQGAKAYSDENIFYNSFMSIEEVNAYTLVPDGRKFKTMNVEDFEVKDAISGGVFFDDRKEMAFHFPGAVKGAIAVLEYTEKATEPRFMGGYYFHSFVPVMKSQFSIAFPKEVSINYRTKGKNPSPAKFKESKKAGLETWTWTATNLPPFEFESDAPGLSYYQPHIIPFIEKVQLGKEERIILKDVSSLYAWYQELTQKVNIVDHPELEAQVELLIEEGDSDLEKTQKIFEWVQQNIKYVAFEDGLGGFIPREASLVYNRRFGDCKDMSSIITEMLKYAGLQAELTWIGTRDIPYSYEEVHTPMVDNHMIASIELEGKRIFLDATDEMVPFGLPTSMIQGKQALVGLKDGGYKLVDVPIVEKLQNGRHETIHLRIEEGTLLGEGHTEFKGFAKGEPARRLSNMPEVNKSKYLKSLLEKGNNKFLVKNFITQGERNPNQALHIEYQFTIEDYVSGYEDEIFVNLNLKKPGFATSIDTSLKKLDLEVDYKRQSFFEYHLQIPEGMDLTYLPENVKFENENFGFNLSYKKQGASVLYSFDWYIDTLLIEKSQFADWNEMIKEMEKAFKESLVLKKKL